MMMNHAFSLDLLVPGTPHRIPVKQGDTLTHSLDISLLADGAPWEIPAGVSPLLRWSVCDPGSGTHASGIYDTLPSGVHAWQYSHNLLTMLTVPQMFALPGLVQTDVVLIQGEKTLATFNFEFYVNQSPADGREPEAQSYYRVATLTQINELLAEFEARLNALEQTIYEQPQNTEA